MSNPIDDPTPGIRGLLSEPNPAHNKGGTHSHKPDCQCYPCKARHRKEEALVVAAGDGGTALVAYPAPTTEAVQSAEPLEADELITPGRLETLDKRAVVAEWIKLRALDPDITNAEIIRRLGIAKSYFYRILNQASKEGWLRFDDPIARLEHQLVPKTLDNLNYFLDAKDRTVTIEMAKGTVFKAYQESKGLNQGSQTILALKIELPATNSEPMKIIEGQIVGQPKIDFDAV